MKKSSLRTGMIVTLRNKEQYYVMLNTCIHGRENDILLKRYSKAEIGWMPLSEYTDTMEYRSDPDGVFADLMPFERTQELDRMWDIVCVASAYNPTDLCIPDRYTTLWERKD